MTTPPAAGAASGAVTSRETPKRYPRQGLKIDTNKHGIRRETNLNQPPSKKGRPKKV
jgi:hypothetical protein